jgi:hypothetical protein
MFFNLTSQKWTSNQRAYITPSFQERFYNGYDSFDQLRRDFFYLLVYRFDLKKQVGRSGKFF